MPSSFLEVCTVFLLFVIIPETTASSERSFSKLKLIKTYLRNYMRQETLRNLAIQSIEHSMARNLIRTEIIVNKLNKYNNNIKGIFNKYYKSFYKKKSI